MEWEPWQGPEKCQRRLARPSPWGWVMAPSVVRDSWMHLSVMTHSYLFHPDHHQPLKPQLCISGVLGLSVPMVCSPLWCHPQSRPKKALCMSWTIYSFLWISRTKPGGECHEQVLLPWRTSICSHHADGMEVPRRVQSYKCLPPA